MSRRTLRWLSVVLTAVGLVFMARTLWTDAAGLDRGLVPGVGDGVALISILALSLLVSYAMWVLVLPSRRGVRTTSVSAYMSAQVAKYVPGGVWQGVGQVVGHTRTHEDSSMVSTTVSYLVQAAAQVAAAAPLALVLLVHERPQQPLVLAGVFAALGGSLLVVRPLMAMGLNWLGRRRTTWIADLELPPQSRVIGVAALGVLTLGLQGAVMARLVGVPATSWIEVGAAYGVAWAVGFAALPLPSGLGLREFMLVALIPGVPAGAVVAASLVLRVGQLLAELGLLLLTNTWSRWRLHREGPPDEVGRG